MNRLTRSPLDSDSVSVQTNNLIICNSNVTHDYRQALVWRLTIEVNGAAILRRPATEGSDLERRVSHRDHCRQRNKNRNQMTSQIALPS